MAVPLPSGVFLSAADCLRLDGLLMRALRDLQVRDGGLPADLAETVGPIHAAAREFRESALISTGSGTTRAESCSRTRSLQHEHQLSAAEVARIAGVSRELVCRAARDGDLKGSKSGRRGAWEIDPDSAAPWTAERRTRRAA